MTQAAALLIYATYRVVPDDVEAFRSLALRMASAATARDGCAFLDVAQDATDPATFRLIEGWRDQAALDGHLASDAFQAALRDAAALGIVHRSADVYHIGEGKVLDLPV